MSPMQLCDNAYHGDTTVRDQVNSCVAQCDSIRQVKIRPKIWASFTLRIMTAADALCLGAALLAWQSKWTRLLSTGR
jgi:hypothetical protein